MSNTNGIYINTIKERLEEKRKLRSEYEKKIKELDIVISEIEDILGLVNENKSDEELLKEVLAPPPKKITFIDRVKEHVHFFGDNEFTVKSLETLLRKKGVDIPIKNPSARLSPALNSLIDDGIIECVYRGKSNDPNRYKLLNGEMEIIVSKQLISE